MSIEDKDIYMLKAKKWLKKISFQGMADFLVQMSYGR